MGGAGLGWAGRGVTGSAVAAPRVLNSPPAHIPRCPRPSPPHLSRTHPHTPCPCAELCWDDQAEEGSHPSSSAGAPPASGGECAQLLLRRAACGGRGGRVARSFGPQAARTPVPPRSHVPGPPAPPPTPSHPFPMRSTSRTRRSMGCASCSSRSTSTATDTSRWTSCASACSGRGDSRRARCHRWVCLEGQGRRVRRAGACVGAQARCQRGAVGWEASQPLARRPHAPRPPASTTQPPTCAAHPCTPHPTHADSARHRRRRQRHD